MSCHHFVVRAAKNERHTAWEALFLKKTSATLHGSAPGRPPVPPDHPKTKTRPRQDRPLKKYRFLIRNVGFSLEKCRFGANRRSWHYVLKRERADFEKKVDFPLEICVIERGGRAARCMGSVRVAHLLASEARRSPASGPREERRQRPYLLPCRGRSIGGSCGTVDNSLKPPLL